MPLALARGAADRPAGPTLDAGVLAKGWTLDGAVALQLSAKAGAKMDRAPEGQPKAKGEHVGIPFWDCDDPKIDMMPELC